MKKQIKNFYIINILFLIFNSFNFLYPGIDGTSSVQYNSKNWVFRGTSNTAQGFVKFEDGITVLYNAVALFDITTPISGNIDLRETGTLGLLSDLHFDSSVTLTSGGFIWGNGKTLYLDNDLTITSVIHINGDLAIDGNGHTLYFTKDSRDNFSQIFVDRYITLTLRNLTLKELSTTGTQRSTTTPIIKLSTIGCQLALDNVVFAPSTDFLFDRGQLYIHNDVLFTGTSSFIYWSTEPCFIAPNSKFYFDKKTTFSFAPATMDNTSLASVAKTLINMQDKTSTLVFDGCSLKTTTTGLILTKGSVFFKNNVNIETLTDLNMTGSANITPLTISQPSTARCVAWHPSGRYFAVGLEGNPFRIYSFDGKRSTLIWTDIETDFTNTYTIDVSWSPDGKYLVATYFYGTVKLYRFNGKSLVRLGAYSRTTNSFNCRSISWSTDGQHFVVASSAVDAFHTEYRVMNFKLDPTNVNGFYLKQNFNSGNNNYRFSISFSPDGKYVILGGDSTVEQLRFYSFNGNSLTNRSNYDWGVTVRGVSWSPDGKVIAGSGSGSGSYNEIKLHKIVSDVLTLVQSVTPPVDAKDYNSVQWSPDAKYLLFGISNTAATGSAFIIKFNGSTLDVSTRVLTLSDYLANIYQAKFSPDGKYFAIAGDGANKRLMIYNIDTRYSSSTFQAQTNGLTFGNKSRGPTYDVDVIFEGGANVTVNGILKDDSY